MKSLLFAFGAAMLMVGIAAARATEEHPPCWGDTSDYRASATKYHFFKEHPCPAGPDEGSTKRCRGYVIDHVCPLECCGKDDPANMQWQTIEEGKAKDKWEKYCGLSCSVNGKGQRKK